MSTVFLQISSGRGPIEFAWVTARLTQVTVAIARDERSQHTNRKRALVRLAALVAYHERKIMETAHQERWHLHNELIRGNPV